MIICYEGGDGSGKDTLAELTAKELNARIFRFPNDEGYTGPLIRSYLAGEWKIQPDPEAETQLAYEKGMRFDADLAGALAFQALQVANRMEVMHELHHFSGHLTDHAVLVRYWQSGWVYGGLDGLDEYFLMMVHAAMVQPDLNILLDIDTDTAIQRQVARGGKLERYEGKREFITQVLDRYRKLWTAVQVFDQVVVDATEEVPEVMKASMGHIMEAQLRLVAKAEAAKAKAETDEV